MSEGTGGRVPRRSVTSAALFVTLGVAFIVAALGAWIAYRTLIHYERRAASHLPASAQFAARLDVEKVVLFEPVRRHLIPLVDDIPLEGTLRRDGSDSSATAPFDVSVVLREADLNLARDLREIVYASLEDGGWVLLLGGLFPKTGLISSIEAAFAERSQQSISRRGETLVLEPWGAALGQASDGVLIAASSERALAAALPVTERSEELGLLSSEAGAMAISPSRLRAWLAVAGVPAEDAPEVGFAAALRLGQTLELDGLVDARDGQRGPRIVERLRAEQQFRPAATAPVPVTEWGGERALLARLEVLPIGDGSVRLRTFLERHELDGALGALAATLSRDMAAAARTTQNSP